MVKIELIYVAGDGKNFHIPMELKQGSTVAEALQQSNIATMYPETKDMPVGIYAKQVALDTLLKDGDRLEIYRPLTLDPKENRRQRACKS